MKKFLLLTVFCVCVALLGNAGSGPLRDVTPDCFEESRIAVMSAYDLDEEDNLVYIGSMGWESFLNPWVNEDGSEEDGFYSLTNNYNNYTLPIWIDYESGQAAMYFYMVDYYEISQKQGRTLYDTIRTVYVLPEAFLFDDTGDEWPDCIAGTIYDDGSIVFEGGFLYYIEDVYNKRNYANHSLISTDTVRSVSPVYYDMMLLVPSGVHTFTRVGQYFTIPEDNINELNGFVAMNSTSILGRDHDWGLAGTCGYGGTIGTPIDPRPIKPGKIWEGSEFDSKYKSSGPNAGGNRDGSTEATYSVPVYMYQSDDSTLVIFNLYGEGLGANYMLLQEDGTMSFPGQQIGFDDANYVGVFNCMEDEESGDVLWGNVGLASADSVTWNLTLPLTEWGLLSYNYKDNKLCFTDGNQFVLPVVPPVPGDVNNDDEVSILDVVLLIDRLLSGDLDYSDGFNSDAADYNQDGEISVLDVSLMIDQLMSE